jgi:hypothetical protein
MVSNVLGVSLCPSNSAGPILAESLHRGSLFDAILSVNEACSGSPSTGRGHVGSMAENKRCRLAEDA